MCIDLYASIYGTALGRFEPMLSTFKVITVTNQLTGLVTQEKIDNN